MSSGLLGPHALCFRERNLWVRVYWGQAVGMVTVLGLSYCLITDSFNISAP